MLEIVEIVLDLVVVGVASVLAVWWFRLSRFFKGGIMGRGFGLAAAGAAIYGVSGFIGIPYELSQSHAIDYLLLGRRAFEVLFLMLLALGMHGFYLAWKTGFSKARSIVDSQGSDSTIR